MSQISQEKQIPHAIANFYLKFIVSSVRLLIEFFALKFVDIPICTVVVSYSVFCVYNLVLSSPLVFEELRFELISTNFDVSKALQ